MVVSRTQLEHTLKRHIKTFAHLYKKTARKANASNVHDLRVLTRRLRTLLGLVPKEQRTPALRKALRHLKRLGRLLGEQRKYDVALEDAQHFGLSVPLIDKRLKSSRKAVLTSLIKPKKHLSELEIALDAFHDTPTALLSSRLQRVHGRLKGHRVPQSNSARHRLRIELKKARYLLEALDRDFPDMKRVQRYLGRWHDLLTLSAMSGHPQAVVAAHHHEWEKAQRLLPPTLKRATRVFNNIVLQ